MVALTSALRDRWVRTRALYSASFCRRRADGSTDFARKRSPRHPRPFLMLWTAPPPRRDFHRRGVQLCTLPNRELGPVSGCRIHCQDRSPISPQYQRGQAEAHRRQLLQCASRRTAGAPRFLNLNQSRNSSRAVDRADGAAGSWRLAPRQAHCEDRALAGLARQCCLEGPDLRVRD
jgi:hypothetical protein